MKLKNNLTSNLNGIMLMIAGMFMFTVNDALGKWLVADYSVGQILAIRSLAALILLLPYLWKKGELKGIFNCTNPWTHTLRVVLVIAEVACFYWAVRYLPLADVFMFYLASPIFVTILSVLFLGEKVGIFRWGAVSAGFLGVALIFPPSEAALTLPALIALVGSLSLEMMLILARSLKDSGGFMLITYQTIGVAAAGLVTLPFSWVTPTPTDFALLCLLGIVATAAHFTINRSVSIAPASAVAPFQYTSIIWAMILGFIFWGDIPTVQAFVGALLVIAAGMLIFWREQRLQRKQKAETIITDEII